MTHGTKRERWHLFVLALGAIVALSAGARGRGKAGRLAIGAARAGRALALPAQTRRVRVGACKSGL